MSDATPITNGWISWRRLMCKAIEATTGPVLELGAGDGSTPYLHALVGSQRRGLITIDGNQEWADKFREYRCDEHTILHAPGGDWAAFALIDSPPGAKRWGCVLVDHAPGERRVEEIRRLANLADVLVIHDTEPAARHGYGYDAIWGLFKHIKHDWPVGEQAAWATAVSNFVDVGAWDVG